MFINKLLLVGLGGFLGSVARYLSVRSVDLKFNAALPFGTMTVNVVGSFVLGVIWAWAARRTGDTENVRLFFITGFCGGFTTFSAFAFENFNLLDQKLHATSIIYIVASVLLGILAVVGGIFAGKHLW